MRPAEADPAACLVQGLGTAKAVAGYDAQFTITATGTDGQPKRTGGDVFRFSLSDSPTNSLSRRKGESDVFDCTTVDHDDGSYTVTYRSTVAGDAYLHIVHQSLRAPAVATAAAVEAGAAPLAVSRPVVEGG